MLFHSGVDALNALKEGAAPVPDLVLLDINLPHMNGYDVATLLSHKREFHSVPIVMLSGHDGIIDRFRAKRAGADEFISKPFDEPELVNKIFPLLALDIPEDIAGHKA
jgi:twitching motility two-component system response regulator PilG